MFARSFLIPLVLIFLALPLSMSASLSTYYVAPWGDDSNPGTKERPWKSPGLATRGWVLGIL